MVRAGQAGPATGRYLFTVHVVPGLAIDSTVKTERGKTHVNRCLSVGMSSRSPQGVQREACSAREGRVSSEGSAQR